MKEWKPIETIKAEGSVHAGKSRFMGQDPLKPGGSVVTNIKIETANETSQIIKDAQEEIPQDPKISRPKDPNLEDDEDWA